MCDEAENKELKWHLALLVSRLSLTKEELGKVWRRLLTWATDKNESRILRVNSLQGLSNLFKLNKELKPGFFAKLSEIEKENIPSLNARIRQLKSAFR